MSDTLDLCIELINRPSVTPDDGGCQSLIEKRLKKSNFQAMDYSHEEVKNTYYFHGSGDPHFIFVGHTDVVPTGPVEKWRFEPFSATEHDGMLYGRGSADMKGSIAAIIVALEQFVALNPNHPDTIGLLLTSDEEGPSKHGIKYVVEKFKEQNKRFQYCLVGEPSSKNKLGDTV